MDANPTNFVSEVISFDIFSDETATNDIDIVDTLTQEEAEEIANVVSVLDNVNSWELINFCSQENTLCHKGISDCELDHLAGKNSAITTIYQTKWARAVMKYK